MVAGKAHTVSCDLALYALRFRDNIEHLVMIIMAIIICNEGIGK